MKEPRITSELWIRAHIRKCNARGISATVVKRGNSIAGAILVKLNCLDSGCSVLVPTNSLLDGRYWRLGTSNELIKESDADAYIQRQLSFDPDLWVLEIEDSKGRHLIEGILEQ